MFDGYRLDNQFLIKLFSEARNDASKALSSPKVSLEAKHNRYCLYTALCFLYATGGRPVNDPLHDLNRRSFDHGIVSLQDKETFEFDSLHFVGLAMLAVDQGNYYLDHLKALASQYLTQYGNNHNIVRGIARLANNHRNSSLPFFFLIESNGTRSITTKTIEQYLAHFISLPPNFHRHVVATEFSIPSTDDGVPPWSFDTASAFLGHQPVGYHLFGPESELCLTEQLANQRAEINRLLSDLNMRPLKGLKAHNKQLIVSGLFKPEKDLHLPTELGPIKRARLREEAQKEDKKLAAEITTFLTTFTEENEFKIKRAAILAERLAKSNYPVGNHWQELISAISKSSEFARLFPTTQRKIRLSFDKTPFNTTTLPRILNLKTARHIWLETINKFHVERTLDDIPTRIASILISAGLFGGILSASRLLALSSSLFNSIYKTESNLVFLELYEKDSSDPELLTRWIPDQLSLTLILGLQRRFELKDLQLPSESEVSERLVEFLGLLSLPSTPKRCFISLAKLANVSASLDYPAYLSQALIGNTGTHISHTAWTRLNTGLVPKSSADKWQEVDVGDWLPLLSSKKPKLDALKPLRNEVSRQLVHNNDNSKYSNVDLATDLKGISQKYRNAPDICHLVIAWIICLCIKGTVRAKTSASAGTIKNYGTLVMDALFFNKAAMKFLDLSDLEHEGLYCSAVDGASQLNQATLVVQLQQFHAWVVENYADIEECAWSSVWMTASKIKPKVSANIISEQEYQRCLALVNSDQALSDRYRFQLKSLLILLRKFGLRFGEAYQLRRVDIGCSPDYSYVVIQINRIGKKKVKSEHGIRQVANLEDLNKNEINVLQKITSDAFCATFNTPIMSNQVDSLVREPKNTVSTYLNHVVKLSTGDQKASLKHFRHVYASQVHAKIISERYPHHDSLKTRPWLDRRLDLYNLTEDTYDKPAKALSLKMGHAAISTTVHSYIHSLETTPHPGDSLALGKNLSAKTLAHLSGESYEAYRKRNISHNDNLSRAIQTCPLPRWHDGMHFIAFDLEARSADLANTLEVDVTPGLVAEVFFYIHSRTSRQAFMHNALNIKASDFWDICNIGDLLENDTNFDDYLLINSVQPIEHRIETLTHPNLSEHQRIRSFFSDFDDLLTRLYIDEKETLAEITDIWRITIRPKKYRLKINLAGRFNAIKQFFSHFRLNIFVRDYRSSTQKSYGSFKRRSTSRERKAARPSERYEVSFTNLLACNSDSINCERDLHKVLFIITAWYQFRELQNAKNNQPLQPSA